jgi:hypothetical protein
VDAVAAPAGAAGAGVAALDARWRLQLLLAGLWLLDGVLQLQSVMFTRQFPAMLAESAAGQPGVVAAPVTWAARLIAGHPAPANAAFAALQIALGLGLAWRPAVLARPDRIRALGPGRVVAGRGPGRPVHRHRQPGRRRPRRGPALRRRGCPSLATPEGKRGESAG